MMRLKETFSLEDPQEPAIGKECRMGKEEQIELRKKEGTVQVTPGIY
jgi:hypothetical protein